VKIASIPNSLIFQIICGFQVKQILILTVVKSSSSTDSLPEIWFGKSYLFDIVALLLIDSAAANKWVSAQALVTLGKRKNH
jgi:hypothetical protein